MKRTSSILLFTILAVVAAGCLSSLIPGNSTLSFTLDGNAYADDKASISRLFVANTIIGDTTATSITVPDENSGNTMMLSLFFAGQDGTKDVTTGIQGVNADANRMTITVYEGSITNPDTSYNYDAVNVSMSVSNWAEDEDGNVTYDATFSGTVEHREAQQQLSISNGVVEVASRDDN